jgi:hypothetical protein
MGRNRRVGDVVEAATVVTVVVKTVVGSLSITTPPVFLSPMRSCADDRMCQRRQGHRAVTSKTSLTQPIENSDTTGAT